MFLYNMHDWVSMHIFVESLIGHGYGYDYVGHTSLDSFESIFYLENVAIRAFNGVR